MRVYQKLKNGKWIDYEITKLVPGDIARIYDDGVLQDGEFEVLAKPKPWKGNENNYSIEVEYIKNEERTGRV